MLLKARHHRSPLGSEQALFWSCLFTWSVFSRPCGSDCVIWSNDKDGGEKREWGERDGAPERRMRAA